ncbi:hypothetical protein CRUP_032296, partial [Coryphaenoides rupestris]
MKSKETSGLLITGSDGLRGPLTIRCTRASVTKSNRAWSGNTCTAPLKRTELVKFALRVQRSCAAVNADAQSWAHLLAIVNTPRDSPSPLPEPSAYFLKVSNTYIQVILSPHQGMIIQIPKPFLVRGVRGEVQLLCLRRDEDPGGRGGVKDAEVEAEEGGREARGGAHRRAEEARQSTGEVPRHAQEQRREVPKLLETDKHII